MPDKTQLCLITPPAFVLVEYAPLLARILDATPVACVRLALAGEDADAIGRAADALREIAHSRDVPVVIERHLNFVTSHGLDGVHFQDGARNVRAARKELGADAIVGAFCGTSRHEGLNAGEAGADYASFGPLGQSLLGTGAQADRDLFAWWSEMIELPIMGEGALNADLAGSFAQVADFLGVGPEIWGTDEPLAALRLLTAQLR